MLSSRAIITEWAAVVKVIRLLIIYYSAYFLGIFSLQSYYSILLYSLVIALFSAPCAEQQRTPCSAPVNACSICVRNPGKVCAMCY